MVVSKLEATGSKELTATLSKEVSATAKDFVVKKGTVTLTPADVVIDGTTVKITLGSKIVKDTYSVAYGETTPATVETEDEKLVELKVVGTAFSQLSDTATNNIVGAGSVDGGNPDATTVNATIEYQAHNQYGENISADILSVTSTFGGKVFKTEPTAKKNGTIVVYDIAAALGIAGTKGNIIIVSKDGVTTTNEVTMSEEAKVAKVTLDGIYNTSSNAFVDAIPAEKDAANFALVISPIDQYDRPISDKTMLYQTLSQAKVLTNVEVDGVVGNKLTADSFDTVEINGEEKLVIKLTGSSAIAGSLQIIVVGDRFGSVMNETIKIEQIDLIKSFTFSAQGTVYNKYPNAMEYTATTVSGQEVTDYKTLSKLVTFDNAAMAWVKNTDGSAKLVYTPNETEAASEALETGNDNMKQNTVLSVTAKANADISAGDQIVIPKTFTVYEKKVPYSLVKYTGDIVSQADIITITKSKFVVEDQYGNTMDSGDGATLTGMAVDYKYGSEEIVDSDNSASWNFNITDKATKLNISVAGMSDTSSAFDVNKAQLTLSLQKVDAQKATNIKAVWNKTVNAATTRDLDGTASVLNNYTFVAPAQYIEVAANDTSSGITTADFKLTGTINGKTITIPASNYTIKTDSYVPITQAEAETAVKTATATFTVSLTDDSGEEYTEEVSCDYSYSAAPSKIVGFGSYSDLAEGSPASIAYTPQNDGAMNAIDDLGLWFYAYDQYGAQVSDTASWTTGVTTITTNNGATPSMEVSLGSNTTNWKLYKNNTKHAYIDYAFTAGVFDVVATLENGMTATQKVVCTANAAGLTTLKTAATGAIAACGTANIASYGVDTKTEYTALKNAVEAAPDAIAAYVAAGGEAASGSADVDTDDYTNAAAVLSAIDAQLVKYKAITAGALAGDISNSSGAKTRIAAIMDADSNADANYTGTKLIGDGTVKAKAAITQGATTGTFVVEFIDGTTIDFTLSNPSGGSHKFDTAIAEGA